MEIKTRQVLMAFSDWEGPLLGFLSPKGKKNTINFLKRTKLASDHGEKVYGVWYDLKGAAGELMEVGA